MKDEDTVAGLAAHSIKCALVGMSGETFLGALTALELEDLADACDRVSGAARRIVAERRNNG